MAEGAPLLREYTVMSCIKGSNPFVSAKSTLKPCPAGLCRFWGCRGRPIFVPQRLLRNLPGRGSANLCIAHPPQTATSACIELMARNLSWQADPPKS